MNPLGRFKSFFQGVATDIRRDSLKTDPQFNYQLGLQTNGAAAVAVGTLALTLFLGMGAVIVQRRLHPVAASPLYMFSGTLAVFTYDALSFGNQCLRFKSYLEGDQDKNESWYTILDGKFKAVNSQETFSKMYNEWLFLNTLILRFCLQQPPRKA